MNANTDALRGALTRWAENHETAPQGWIAHGFSEGLALAQRLAGDRHPGQSGLWTDEAREHLRVGCAAAGDLTCAVAYREAFEAGYRAGKALHDMSEYGGE